MISREGGRKIGGYRETYKCLSYLSMDLHYSWPIVRFGDLRIDYQLQTASRLTFQNAVGLICLRKSQNMVEASVWCNSRKQLLLLKCGCTVLPQPPPRGIF